MKRANTYRIRIHILFLKYTGKKYANKMKNEVETIKSRGEAIETKYFKTALS